MREDLKLTFNNDEQIVMESLAQKKLQSCTWILDTKDNIERPDKLKDKIRICNSILGKLGIEELKDELNEEDGE